MKQHGRSCKRRWLGTTQGLEEPSEGTKSICQWCQLTSKTDNLVRSSVSQSKSLESSADLNNFPTHHDNISKWNLQPKFSTFRLDAPCFTKYLNYGKSTCYRSNKAGLKEGRLNTEKILPNRKKKSNFCLKHTRHKGQIKKGNHKMLAQLLFLILTSAALQ